MTSDGMTPETDLRLACDGNDVVGARPTTTSAHGRAAPRRGAARPATRRPPLPGGRRAASGVVLRGVPARRALSRHRHRYGRLADGAGGSGAPSTTPRPDRAGPDGGDP